MSKKELNSFIYEDEYLRYESFLKGFSKEKFDEVAKDGEISSPNSLHTSELHATCICSSLEMSAETVRIPASPQKRKKGSRTKKIARSATIALVIV